MTELRFCRFDHGPDRSPHLPSEAEKGGHTVTYDDWGTRGR